MTGPSAAQTKQEGQRFLHAAHSYLLGRLGSLSSHCVVCDAPLKLPGAKPVPCMQATCVFAYDELGVGSGELRV